jgi:hypothetical protein
LKTGLAAPDLIALASVLVAVVALLVSLYSAHVAQTILFYLPRWQ